MQSLSELQRERLFLLMEECSEVIQACTKMLRHGRSSTHPDGGPTNLENLTKEVGDLKVVIELLVSSGDVDRYAVEARLVRKLQQVLAYTRQPEDLVVPLLRGLTVFDDVGGRVRYLCRGAMILSAISELECNVLTSSMAPFGTYTSKTLVDLSVGAIPKMDEIDPRLHIPSGV